MSVVVVVVFIPCLFLFLCHTRLFNNVNQKFFMVVGEVVRNDNHVEVCMCAKDVDDDDDDAFAFVCDKSEIANSSKINKTVGSTKKSIERKRKKNK